MNGSDSAYKLLGFTVWQAGKWYARRTYHSALPSRRGAALAGLGVLLDPTPHFVRGLEFLHFSGPKAAPDTKSCSIIPSGRRIWREKTLALYQGMAFSHAAHC